MYLALISAIILVVVNYFSEGFRLEDKNKRAKVISFVGGLSVTYIF